MRLDESNEFDIIARLSSRVRRRDRDRVIVGIGDDAAVLDTRGDEHLLATCDSQMEGVHFVSSRMSPDRIGRRVAAVNLSDIAAMGGRPMWALALIAAPGDLSMEDLESLYEGMIGELEAAGAALVGGNTARSKGGLIIDLTLLGAVEKGRQLTRSTARAGDLLCVTGTIGAAAAGLAALEAGLEARPELAEVIERHLTPVPRVAAGIALAASAAVSSCIDLSDGLLSDAGHVAKASRVRIDVDSSAVPISRAAITAAEVLPGGGDPLTWALSGGEDFELLFTVAPRDATRVLDLLEAKAEVRASVIGSVLSGAGGVTVDGRAPRTARTGYRHFGE